MKIQSIKISYSTTIPIMSYGVNDKISVDLEMSPATWTNIESGETTNESFNLEQLISEHKANVDAIVRKLYPNFYGTDVKSFGENYSFGNARFSPEFPPIPQPSTHEEIRIGDIENDIRSCTELKVLETYRLIAKSKPEFQAAYDEVYAKLSNQK